ncbi:Bud site selection protein 20 [Orbilia ellipsospora]|uniref:Bud site selection protein 20 n=1 Tax=Orbilia ellipsospora TaxID=2528407 RepID=A0AAV9XQR8_9PEZI
MGPQRLRKTRNRTRDLDQISTDLHHPLRLRQHLSTLPLEDLPALGQHYCPPCAKFLETSAALLHHQRSKAHKKRLKLLKEPAYSHEEANAAVGRGTDNGLFKVTPDDVINRIARERILAKTASTKTEEGMSICSEMEGQVELDNAPELVHDAGINYVDVEEDL